MDPSIVPSPITTGRKTIVPPETFHGHHDITVRRFVLIARRDQKILAAPARVRANNPDANNWSLPVVAYLSNDGVVAAAGRNFDDERTCRKVEGHGRVVDLIVGSEHFMTGD